MTPARLLCVSRPRPPRAPEPWISCHTSSTVLPLRAARPPARVSGGRLGDAQCFAAAACLELSIAPLAPHAEPKRSAHSGATAQVSSGGAEAKGSCSPVSVRKTVFCNALRCHAFHISSLGPVADQYGYKVTLYSDVGANNNLSWKACNASRHPYSPHRTARCPDRTHRKAALL